MDCLLSTGPTSSSFGTKVIGQLSYTKVNASLEMFQNYTYTLNSLQFFYVLKMWIFWNFLDLFIFPRQELEVGLCSGRYILVSLYLCNTLIKENT